MVREGKRKMEREGKKKRESVVVNEMEDGKVLEISDSDSIDEEYYPPGKKFEKGSSQKKIALENKIIQMESDLRSANEKVSKLATINEEIQLLNKNLKSENDNLAQTLKRSSQKRETLENKMILMDNDLRLANEKVKHFQNECTNLKKKEEKIVDKLKKSHEEIISIKEIHDKQKEYSSKEISELKSSMLSNNKDSQDKIVAQENIIVENRIIINNLKDIIANLEKKANEVTEKKQSMEQINKLEKENRFLNEWKNNVQSATQKGIDKLKKEHQLKMEDKNNELRLIKSACICQGNKNKIKDLEDEKKNIVNSHIAKMEILVKNITLMQNEHNEQIRQNESVIKGLKSENEKLSGSNNDLSCKKETRKK